MAKFRNHYECPCGATWSDESDYTNNDRCPKCRKEIQPSDSEDIGPDDDEENIALTISTRQRDAILCGLRLLQRETGANYPGGACDYFRLSDELRDLATCGDEHQGLLRDDQLQRRGRSGAHYRGPGRRSRAARRLRPCGQRARAGSRYGRLRRRRPGAHCRWSDMGAALSGRTFREVTIWTLSSATPEGNTVRPTHPDAFATEAEALAAYRKAMAEEWPHNGPDDYETGARAEMPDDPDQAHEAIVEAFAGSDVDEPWGEWRLASHTVDVRVPIFIVAYDDDDGPYALAFSDRETALRVYEERVETCGRATLTETTMDAHADLATLRTEG